MDIAYSHCKTIFKRYLSKVDLLGSFPCRSVDIYKKLQEPPPMQATCAFQPQKLVEIIVSLYKKYGKHP
jgi:hypothetical protein